MILPTRPFPSWKGWIFSNFTWKFKISSSVTVKCSAYETKTTYLFSQTTSIVGYEQNRKAQYKTIYQYRYKTRKLIKEAGYDIKWSESQSDKTLINKGYKLTGKKRVKG